MKKFLQQLVTALLFINLALTLTAFANNAPTAPGDTIVPINKLQEIGAGTNLPSFDSTGQHADAPPEYLQPGVGTLTSPALFVIDILRFIASTVAVLVLFVNVGRLLGDPTDEQADKSKQQLLWGVVGLILIQFADTLVKKMFFGEQGEAFEDAGTSELFAQESVSQIRGIIGFIEVFIGVAAVLVIIVRGFRLVTSLGEEEAMTKAKDQIIWAAGGLVVVGLSEIVVRGFLFPEAGNALPNDQVGKAIIISITNFASGFVAIFAFANLFYAGYRYVTSGGNDEVSEKVKKSFFGSVVALLLALGAYAAVNTFITLDPRPDEVPNSSEQVQQNPPSDIVQ